MIWGEMYSWVLPGLKKDQKFCPVYSSLVLLEIAYLIKYNLEQIYTDFLLPQDP